MDLAEIPAPHRPRAISYYVALFGLVVPFCSTIPIAWTYVIYLVGSGRVWNLSLVTRALFSVALCEVLFSVYQFHLSRTVSPPAPYGPGDLREIQAAFRRLLQTGLANLPVDGGDEESNRPGSPEEDIIQLEFNDPRAIDFRNALRPWFGNAVWSSIRLNEVREWLYWSIYNADLPPYDCLTTSQRIVLEAALDLLQKRCGCIFEEGSNPSIRTMRMTLDKVNIVWRPFTFYLMIFLVNSSLRKWYKYAWNSGFGTHEGLEYLIRTPKHWDPATGPRPLVFIHGLGLGLFQYSNLIQHLMQQLPDRPILVLLQPQISQHIFHPRFLKPMTRHETADRLARLLTHLGWVQPNYKGGSDSEEEKEIAHSLVREQRRGVTMLSHSNGSYIHAWMLKGHQKIIERSCFVDPVTFCSWEGDVCFNFLYRHPKTAMEILMRYFVATEIGVANLLARHFDWASNTLWFEDIPNARDPSKTLFLLGGEDSIIRSERVKRYLTSHRVKQGLLFDPTASHGQALQPGTRGRLEIVQWIQEART